MKQNPSRLKYKKYHKLSNSYYKYPEKKLFLPSKGIYALQVIESGKLLKKQIESTRKGIRRNIKKSDSLTICVFPFISVTKKPVAVRMGKGKGNHSH